MISLSFSLSFFLSFSFSPIALARKKTVVLIKNSQIGFLIIIIQLGDNSDLKKKDKSFLSIWKKKPGVSFFFQTCVGAHISIYVSTYVCEKKGAREREPGKRRESP